MLNRNIDGPSRRNLCRRKFDSTGRIYLPTLATSIPSSHQELSNILAI